MNRIAELRKEKGLTLQQVADAVGVGNNTISRYETGKRKPILKMWIKLADFFDVSISYLAGTKLSYKQRTCPVCHGDVGLRDVYQDHNNFNSLWIDGNRLYEESIIGGNVISTEEFNRPTIINYCPMCGRYLGGDHDD